MDRRGAFDYILLETTGLADPGNIAPLFWVDEGLGSTIYLDGIVTLVDAKNITKCLDAPTGEETVHDEEEPSHQGHAGKLLSTAHLQLSHADVLVINKADLVSEQELQDVEDRVRSINSLAQVRVTKHSQVPQLEGFVLDLHAYDHVDAANLDFASKGHSHLDPTIATIALTLPVMEPEGLSRLDEWLRSVLWENSLPGVSQSDAARWEIHRIKGRIVLDDGRVKMLQGVREVFDFIDAPKAASDLEVDKAAVGKIVIIGRNIGDITVTQAFERSLLSTIKGR